MNIPFSDLRAHYHSNKGLIDDALHRVMESGHYILGSETERFENEFASYLGCGSVAGCASGTEAIYLALAACEVGAGDEVLVVAHTAVPTISAISMTGATPVFVDIDPKSFVMDVTKLKDKITARTKVIVPVHLYGQMVDMDSLLALASEHGLKVVEDVAQATGASYRGRKAGTIGDFGAFSFYPTKNLGAFGDGGAVSTNSSQSLERLKKLRNYGQSKRYHHDVIGINSRLDELQASMLSAQLPYLDGWNTRRLILAKRYKEVLEGTVSLPQQSDLSTHVYHLYVIQTPYRDELQDYLLSRGIQTLIHYPIPAHLQEAYKYLGYNRGDLPVTEATAESILSLPIYPEMPESQVEAVSAAISDFFKSISSASNSSITKQSVSLK